MKKRSICLFLLALVFTVCFFTTVPALAASKVKLNTKSLALNVGDKSTLTLENASGTVNWTVSKKNIVTISGEGTSVTIKGKKAGSTYVKAEYNGKTYKCKVTISSSDNGTEGISCTIKIYDIYTMKYVNRKGQYVGDVTDGVPNGKGQFYTKNSAGAEYVISGTFKNGKLDGKYTITFDDHNEIYESKNGKFIKTTFYYSDGDIAEYILKDNILYESYEYKDSGRTEIAHYSDNKVENYTVIDWLYAIDYSDSYSGYEISVDSVMYMDSIRRLSNTKIKEKASYIEAKKIKKSVSQYTNSVDYLKKAYVVQCDEFNVHESWGIDKPITKMILAYDDYIYVIWYEGSIDVYEGDYVSCWFTPFANISYNNIANTITKATAGVAYVIKTTK